MQHVRTAYLFLTMLSNTIFDLFSIACSWKLSNVLYTGDVSDTVLQDGTGEGVRIKRGYGRTDGPDGRTDRTDGRTGRTDRTDGPVGRTGRTDRTDGPDGRTGRTDGPDGRTDGLYSLKMSFNSHIYPRFIQKDIQKDKTRIWFRKRCSAFSETYPRFIQKDIQKDKTRIWCNFHA